MYRLTADGKERLADLLGEGGPAAWEDDGFGVHFAFFGQTRADVRLRILEGRRSRLEERMEGIRAAFTRTRERLDSYTLELHRHGLESVEREVRWLNELIASERQASGPRQHFRELREGVILMGKVRVAIAGVGNCASSLVQGVEYYRDADPTTAVPGLMHVELGGYHVGDVEFVAAFDVDADKVGLDLGKAIFAEREQHHQVRRRPPTGVDGAARPDLRRPRRVLPRDRRGVAGRAGRRGRRCCATTRADVLVSYLPVGSEEAQNATTPRRASTPASRSSTPSRCSSPPTPSGPQKFTDAGVPIVGDDIKSQVGATIVHRMLARLFEDRGIEL